MARAYYVQPKQGGPPLQKRQEALADTRLCRISGGWDVLFDHIPMFSSMADIRRFFTDPENRDRLVIADEYGEVMEPEEFFAMVETWNRQKGLLRDRPGMTVHRDEEGYAFRRPWRGL